MRRFGLVYLLIVVVLGAASALAMYGYSYSSVLSSRERLLIMDTMRELAQEKVLGIENEVNKSDTAIFAAVDIDNLPEFQQLLDAERPAVENVLILDERLEIMPSGFFTRVGSRREIDRVRKFFETRVVRDLPLRSSPLQKRNHAHRVYQGRPYLFSWSRRIAKDRVFYVLIECDASYLVGTVFPQYFPVHSPRLYQVVDERGDVVYGFDFRDIPDSEVVELRFVDTASRWRLRVAQKERTRTARSRRQVVDVILIGTALAVVAAGLGVLLLAVRRERRASDLKSDFISNVSHELKTPLSIISMFGEMLAMGRTKSPEQASEYAEIIWRESVRLSRLIDNVLDFEKIEKGADPFEFTEGDLVEVVDRAVELSQHRLDRVGLSLQVRAQPGLPRLHIDANALTLALLNLIDNAIKYGSEGKRLQISVHRKGRRVELEVRDYGPGIPAPEQHAIFERFYRSRSATVRSIRGSGIGLALVKHVAEAHGGGVTVSSPVGGGALFRLWIPLPGQR